uniref:Pleiotrophin/Midkine C-terminal domain-containing protein n=1 Tax=Plectus sambesii TaxID=2011161 RepID=A0A914UQC9_9BILA
MSATPPLSRFNFRSNEAVAQLLRDSDGLLRENIQYRSPGGLAYMPFDSEPSENTPCHRNKSQSSIHCFLAGDRRTNEQLMLLSLHTLFFREHNRIAKELKLINPEWSAETIYQEARKIIGAVIQKITFDDWLPIIIGPVGMALVGEYKGYKPDTNAGVENAVATAAMRFGHGLMVPVLRRLDPNFNPIPEGDVQLRDAFFAPHKLLEEGGIDPLLRGAVAAPTKDIVPDGIVNSELTDHLFPNFHRFALDLPALNIQRGRDHALPPYNAYRELCGLHRIATWDALKPESRDAKAVDRLAELYGHPDNLDLWVGGMLERPLRGAKIGQCSSQDCLCRYRLGSWGQCDVTTGKQDRVDQLVSGSFPPCTNSRTITRRCSGPIPRAFVSPIKQPVNGINVNLHFNDDALGQENMRLLNGNRKFGNLLNRRHDLFANMKSPLLDRTQFRDRSA